jgi:hypothetical protein
LCHISIISATLEIEARGMIARLRTAQAKLARSYLKSKIKTKGLNTYLKW